MTMKTCPRIDYHSIPWTIARPAKSIGELMHSPLRTRLAGEHLLKIGISNIGKQTNRTHAKESSCLAKSQSGSALFEGILHSRKVFIGTRWSVFIGEWICHRREMYLFENLW
jgi:hypothetical protein